MIDVLSMIVYWNWNSNMLSGVLSKLLRLHLLQSLLLFHPDDARREGDNETSAATLTTAISEASSSNLVHHDSLLRTCDGSKSLITNDPKDSASLDGGDQTEQTKIEGMAVEPENQKKLADAIVNNREQGAKPVEKSSVRPPAIQSPQPCKDLPVRRRKPCYGWLSDSDEEDLVHLPLPPLPEEIKKLLEQNAAPQRSSQRRRTRWIYLKISLLLVTTMGINGGYAKPWAHTTARAVVGGGRGFS
ncbi:putative WIYLD domain-containing protein [Senna tora]|uniref:Putative WIYLD domain-containing protein n=1 Tax=Senna tora TaxID=362788 RepID=A0A834TY71_9FABA|nr:putative WIYLD domain-containing protein [Senna tora]